MMYYAGYLSITPAEVKKLSLFIEKVLVDPFCMRAESILIPISAPKELENAKIDWHQIPNKGKNE